MSDRNYWRGTVCNEGCKFGNGECALAGGCYRTALRIMRQSEWEAALQDAYRRKADQISSGSTEQPTPSDDVLMARVEQWLREDGKTNRYAIELADAFAAWCKRARQGVADSAVTDEEVERFDHALWRGHWGEVDLRDGRTVVRQALEDFASQRLIRRRGEENVG